MPTQLEIHDISLVPQAHYVGSFTATGASSYGSSPAPSSTPAAAVAAAPSHQLNPYDRSMYPYNTPGTAVGLSDRQYCFGKRRTSLATQN